MRAVVMNLPKILKPLTLDIFALLVDTAVVCFILILPALIFWDIIFNLKA